MIAAFALMGCGAGVLIRADDATHARSLSRLAATQARLAASGAPADEVAMFLQAEALYLYRYEPPRRGAGAYLAQAAAVALDFPALQAVSASLDLFQIRIRANDAAVQVWESLLATRPRTTLRPQALYRLGWAYRNVVSPGLPGGSAAAFDRLVREAPGTPLAALAAEARRTPWKSQGKATAWSILPGAGQIYAGEVWNGTVRLSIAVAAGAAVIAPAVIAYQRRDDLTWQDDWPLLATALGGVIVLSIDYSLSYEDALRAVLQHNERAEAAFLRAHPDAP